MYDLQRRALSDCLRVYSEYPEKMKLMCDAIRFGDRDLLLGFADALEMILPDPIEDPVVYFLASIPDCLPFITEQEAPFELTLEDCWNDQDLEYFSDLEIVLASGFWVPSASRREWLQELQKARTEPTFFLPRIPIPFQLVDRPVEPNSACGRTETITGQPEEDVERIYCYGTLKDCCLLSSMELQQIVRQNRGGRRGRLLRNPWTGKFMSAEMVQRCRDLAEYLEDDALFKCLPNPQFSLRDNDLHLR